MAKEITQLRYYQDYSELEIANNQSKNFPKDLNKIQLITGAAFSYPILQLGIQTLPGTKFYVNGNPSTRPIIIGATGIYELGLSDLFSIDSLQFDYVSLDKIEKQENAALLIDIIYEAGVVE